MNIVQKIYLFMMESAVWIAKKVNTLILILFNVKHLPKDTNIIPIWGNFYLFKKKRQTLMLKIWLENQLTRMMIFQVVMLKLHTLMENPVLPVTVHLFYLILNQRLALIVILKQFMMLKKSHVNKDKKSIFPKILKIWWQLHMKPFKNMKKPYKRK